MRDVFRPRDAKLRAIYDAFQAQAAKRVWFPDIQDALVAERVAVLVAARTFWPGITMEAVERAERQAEGHTDYGAKWVYGIRDLMDRQEAAND